VGCKKIEAVLKPESAVKGKTIVQGGEGNFNQFATKHWGDKFPVYPGAKYGLWKVLSRHNGICKYERVVTVKNEDLPSGVEQFLQHHEEKC